MMLLAALALGFSLLPALLYSRNVRLFRRPVAGPIDIASLPAISVLIPARNEEASIAACIQSVLTSEQVTLECVVLDDDSSDRTAEIVRDLARSDPRVRLERSPALPDDWAGKQHACFTLAQHARHPILVFLDADVRLNPLALASMTGFLHQSQAGLISGFPRQVTVTLFEKLLIPLMHFLLLGFLPFDRMRKELRPSLGAGCGQLFMTSRQAYDAVGGHGHHLVRKSFHDGIQLPRAYREKGIQTDLCDITELTSCRMYRTASQVWNGLAKNAREGLGAPKMILFTSLLLGAGQVLPFLLMAWIAVDDASWILTASACICAWYPRFDSAWRFRQSWLGALLHPVGISLLLGIQWYANARSWLGRPIGWRGRVRSASTPNVSLS